MKEIRSARKGKALAALYALVELGRDGTEGIVRRNTPVGTIPWITDDAKLALRLPVLAQSEGYKPTGAFRIVKFTRVPNR